MNTETLKPCSTVTGPLFPEPVQGIVCVPIGASVKLSGKGPDSGQVYEPVLDENQLKTLELSPEQPPFNADPGHFRLGWRPSGWPWFTNTTLTSPSGPNKPYSANRLYIRDAATAYLRTHLNTEYVIKSGPREEILELPEEALREALVNAMAHRDCRSTSNSQVNIYNDRVEIWDPGGLVSDLKLKDLGHVSRPRNLLLFSLMARMNLVENIGSGIKRIRDAVAAYALKPPLIQA